MTRTTRCLWAGLATSPGTQTRRSAGESATLFTFEITVPDTILVHCRMPIFIGDQGTGKGIILGNLLIKIFDKLGIHCTNFGSVTQKFNSDFKSFVFVDEGVSEFTLTP